MLSLSLFWNTAFSSAHSVWRERKEKGREKEEVRQEEGKHKFLVIQFLFAYTLLSSLLIPSPFLLCSHFPTPSLPILINLPLPAYPLLSSLPLPPSLPPPILVGLRLYLQSVDVPDHVIINLKGPATLHKQQIQHFLQSKRQQ